MEFGRTPADIEHNRKVFLIALYALTGSVFLIPLGMHSLLNGRTVLGVALLVNAVLAMGTMLYSRATARVIGPSFLFAVQAGMLAVFLALHGGIEGSGVYFSFPLVLMMVMLGFTHVWTAALLCLVLMLLVALGFYLGIDGAHVYPEVHKSRILMGLAALCLMSMIFEWIRKQSYAAITHTTELLNVDASHDLLTGLMNRRGFENKIIEMSEEDFPAVMGVIDIDHFKEINDEFGHDAGDVALKFLGEQLSGSVKGRDLTCRWGGEEFVVLFTHLSIDSGVVLLDQIRDEVGSSVIRHGGKQFEITFSAGVVELPTKRDFESGLKLADERLYHAKQSGRNRVVSIIGDDHSACSGQRHA